MFTNEKFKTIFPAFLLLVICGLVYSPLIHNQFLMDDFVFLQFHHVFQIFEEPLFLLPRPASHHFEPLYRLTNAMLFPLLQTAAHLYILNIILFYINCYLLFILVLTLTRNFSLALLTSLLFCLHPMSAEVVMHITFNNILICTGLMELSLISLCKHIEQKRGSFFYILSLCSFSIALLFQEISILFPLYAALLLFYKTANIKKTFRLSFPFIALSCGLITLWLCFAGPGARLLERLHALNLDLFTYTANLFLLIKWHISNLFFPANIIYMFNMLPIKNFIWLWNLLFFGLIASALFLVFHHLKRSLESFALLFFMIGFLLIIPGSLCRPHMGLVVSPYWFYFPSIGFFLLIASIMLRMKEYTNKYLFTIFVGAIFIFLLTYTRQQLPLGKNEAVYCINWLKKSPRNTLALGIFEGYFSRLENMKLPEFLSPQMSYLVDWLLEDKQNARAIRLIKRLQQSENADKKDRTLLYRLAVAYYKNNNIDLAENIIKQILDGSSEPTDLFRLSYTLYKKGLTQKAKELLEQCQTLYPSYKETYMLLGVILANEKKYIESILWWKKGRELDTADTRFNENIKKSSHLLQQH